VAVHQDKISLQQYVRLTAFGTSRLYTRELVGDLNGVIRQKLNFTHHRILGRFSSLPATVIKGRRRLDTIRKESWEENLLALS